MWQTQKHHLEIRVQTETAFGVTLASGVPPFLEGAGGVLIYEGLVQNLPGCMMCYAEVLMAAGEN